MSEISRQQARVGLVTGAAAFVTGPLVTAAVAGEPARIVPTLEAATVQYLAAVGVPLAGVDAVGTPPARPLAVAVAVLSCTVAGLVAVEWLPYTTHPRYLAENAACQVLGYVVAGFVAIVVVGTGSMTGAVVLAAAVAVAAVYVGGWVARAATGGLPVLGVVSLGGVVLVGVAALVVGFVVVRAGVPLLAVSLAGGAVAAALAGVARRG